MNELLAPSFRFAVDDPAELAAADAQASPAVRTALAGNRPLRPSISCVLPAYNEAASLPLLLQALTRQLAELTDQWEVLVVDDGSTDSTAGVLLPWLVRPGVRYLRLSRNFGKESALTAGLDHTAGQVVLLMDADLQHPVALLPEMLRAWADGADMVCAMRASRADEGLVKRLGTALFYQVLNRGSAVQVPAGAGDFRLLDHSVVQALRQLPERNRFMKGLYAWVGFRTVEIPYQPRERHAGASHYSLRRLMRLAFTGVTSFTNAPLRLWSGVGATVALAALAYGGWIVLEHTLYGIDVPGWATVVAGMMFLSGVQLLSIGMLGEYVGRIFDEVKQRPVYLLGSESGRGNIHTLAGPAPLP